MEDRVLRGISPALQELLAWLLSVDTSGTSAEDARTHSWFGPSQEAAQEHEEGAVTPLQPLGVPRDPEAREYLAGLGLLPGTGTEWRPGPQPQDPAALPKSSQSSKRPPIEDYCLALVSRFHDSMADVSSAQSDSSEASSQPLQERSPAPSAAPDSSEPSSQLPQERSPAPSAAPEPASKASPSSPSARSRVDLAEPEAAAAAREPEGAGTAATADTTASAQGKRQGRRGVGRRILRFLLRACCILPSRGSSSGHCCCRKAPK
nr:nematocyst expressed protein 3-like [Oryctolagus cuniculus]